MSVFINDLQKALDIEEGRRIPDPEVNYMTNPFSEEGNEYINSCKRYGYSCDIETTGLSPYKGKILGLAISCEPGTGIFFKLPEMEDLVRNVLTADCSKTFQFGQFDVFFLKQKGYDVTRWEFDTKYAQNLIAPGLPSALSFLSSIYTMYPYYKDYLGTEMRKNMAAVPQDALAEYCIRDADVTEIVRRELKDELEDDSLTSLMKTITMPLAHAVVDMRLNGLRIDQEVLDNYQDSYGPNTERLKEHFEKLGVNPNSPKQIGEYLVNVHHLPMKVTKTGRPKTDARTIKNLHKKYNIPILDLLIRYRENSKIYSTYIEGIDKIKVNNRLHADLIVGGTETGRLSCRNPNLQNQPKDIRDIFIPEDGHLFVDADYNQLEMHVLYVLSKDKQLGYDLTNDVYIPTEIGKSMGWDEEKCSLMKKVLKGVMYGTLYGRGARAIAIEFGMRVSEAKEVQTGFLDRYPGVRGYLEGERSTATTTGIIVTPFGRRRQFIGDRVATQSYNHKIQSCAGDILSTSTIKVHRRIPRLLKLTIHDEILLSVPEEAVEYWKGELVRIMEEPVPQMDGYSFPASVSTGKNWRECA